MPKEPPQVTGGTVRNPPPVDHVPPNRCPICDRGDTVATCGAPRWRADWLLLVVAVAVVAGVAVALLAGFGLMVLDVIEVLGRGAGELAP